VEHKGDDIDLCDLDLSRPEYLICCAANDLTGDGLQNLHRGAFHACLSRSGIHVGKGREGANEEPAPGSCNWEHLDKQVTLGAALTASAAAFNSVMGSKSKALGPAVTFVLTALNMRLGLWVRNPAFKWQEDKTSGIGWTFLDRVGRALPGWHFFAEMFSQVRCRVDERPNRYIHLSDGGHFENLGLYELVRRRCRYILVSDCGADPNYQFADLGNAVRRIRVDLGADVLIDTGPLVPDESGVALQHVAVGQVRYAPGDYGVLIYIKPCMTGDEPSDVRQYAGQHASFPHESTGDQFYNEAQWEAYRSLGFHAAKHAFTYVDQGILAAGPMRIFNEARWHWTRLPKEIAEKVTIFTKRWDDMVKAWWTHLPEELLHELFPEKRSLSGAVNQEVADERDVDAVTLTSMIEFLGFIEDLWRETDLDVYQNYPAMRG
jgi:hypothetical protein